MAKAILVQTNGEVRPIELENESSGRVISELVGGIFTAVRNHKMNITAYVHDEGLLIKLDPNACVSAIFNQLLVGDAVICGADDDEGYHLDLHEMFFEPEFSQYAFGMNNKPAMNEELARLRDKIAEQPIEIISF